MVVVLVDCRFDGEWERRTSAVNIEVAIGTMINVLETKFIAVYAFIIFFVAKSNRLENKRMIWVQGMVQLKGKFCI